MFTMYAPPSCVPGVLLPGCTPASDATQRGVLQVGEVEARTDQLRVVEGGALQIGLVE